MFQTPCESNTKHRQVTHLCPVWQTPAWSRRIFSGRTGWRRKGSGCDGSAASYHRPSRPSSSGVKEKTKPKTTNGHHRPKVFRAKGRSVGRRSPLAAGLAQTACPGAAGGSGWRWRRAPGATQSGCWPRTPRWACRRVECKRFILWCTIVWEKKPRSFRCTLLLLKT